MNAGAPVTTQQIIEEFYFVIAMTIIASVIVSGQCLAAKKGKSVDERWDKLMSHILLCGIEAAEHFSLWEHPEAVAKVSMD